MKKYYFLSGLPRSGSTLLCNILLQNPDIYASATSSLIDILIPIKNGWNQLPGMRAMKSNESKLRLIDTLRGCFSGFYDSIDKPVIIDKSRAWPSQIPMLLEIFDDVKIIVTVRDLRAVMSSMEKLYRKNKAFGSIPGELEFPQNFVSVEARVKFWAQNNQLIGASLNIIRDAQNCGFSSHLHFVDFKALTQSPKSTLEGIYNFLDMPVFEHDFNNVEQITVEDDRAHGWTSLHDIRNKVTYPQPDYNEILGKDLARSLQGQEIW